MPKFRIVEVKGHREKWYRIERRRVSWRGILPLFYWMPEALPFKSVEYAQKWISGKSKNVKLIFD